MSVRAKYLLIALALCVLFWLAVAGAFAGSVSREYVAAHPERYDPPACVPGGICTIDDCPGGVAVKWALWGLRHSQSETHFVVSGLCTSACWLEMEKAKRGGRVTILSTARYHWGH